MNRVALWKTLFEVAQAHQNQAQPIETVYTAVLQRLAPQLGLNYAQLLHTLLQQLEQDRAPSELTQIVTILSRGKSNKVIFKNAIDANDSRSV